MAISFSCNCGRALRLKDALAGKRIRCPECEAILTVPQANGVETDFEVVERQAKAEAQNSKERFQSPVPIVRPMPVPIVRPIQDQALGPPSSDGAEERRRPRRRRRQASRDSYRDDGDRRRHAPSVAISPAVISGVAMMVVAVVWFVLGLFFGWVFFYPPVLFILGLVALIRGCLGYSED